MCGVTYSIWMLVISFWDDHDLDATIYERTNHCLFVHNGKKVKLMPNQTKSPSSENKIDKNKGKVETPIRIMT